MSNTGCFAEIIFILFVLILGMFGGFNSLPNFETFSFSSLDNLGCSITTTENDVGVHVGPGFNRGRLAFLPANDIYSVLGTNLNDAGELWYQIDYNNAAQAWVINSSVELAPFANCSDLTDVEAPPIIQGSRSGNVQIEDVWHCEHLGGNNFQWYRVEVTYDNNGQPSNETVLDGPFTGEWRPGCPAGEPSGGGGEEPPPASNSSDSGSTGGTTGGYCPPGWTC